MRKARPQRERARFGTERRKSAVDARVGVRRRDHAPVAEATAALDRDADEDAVFGIFDDADLVVKRDMGAARQLAETEPIADLELLDAQDRAIVLFDVDHDEIEIVVVAAQDGVAGIRDEQIFAEAAGQSVPVRAAVENVVAVTALERIASATADESIIAASTEEGVVAHAAAEEIDVLTAERDLRIERLSGVEQVLAVAEVERVRPILQRDHAVVAGAEDEGVTRCVADRAVLVLVRESELATVDVGNPKLLSGGHGFAPRICFFKLPTATVYIITL